MNNGTHTYAPRETEKLETRRIGDTLVLVAVVGEIDAHTMRALQRVILEAQRGAPGRTVVLDLRPVRLIDAAGWTMLIGTHQQMVREGRRLRVLLARGSQPFRAFVTRWLHVVLDRIDGLEDLPGPTPA